jgi:DNA-binding transcriptional ArsR family regulator
MLREMPSRNGTGIELLADPTRRRIVALLALGHCKSSKVAAEIGLSRPATSRQLRLLRQAGLITARRGWVDGRLVVYYIDPKRLGQIAAWLAGTEVGRAFPQALPRPPGADDGSA